MGDDDADAALPADVIAAAKVEQRDAVADLIRANVRRELVGTEAAPRIGRFTLLETLGRGAMGRVFAAYDPVLDRKVALKLLDATGERGRAELLREARALAKLNHPHVVAVHEADEHEGRVYIAMEFVAGPDLRAWLDSAPQREPPEILEVFAQAGRGLAAAHDAGVAHGDFKPHNVIVGPSGAKVADFGMAYVAGGEDAGHGGTPRYMAPERLSGGPPSAAADLFAFAVALWEALFGSPPFEGATAAALREAMEAPPVVARRPGVSARVPGVSARTVDELKRALAVSPSARHGSMHELLAKLQPPPSSRRSLVGGLGLAGVALLAAWVARGGAADGDPCAGGEAEARALWNDAAAASVHEAFIATGAGFADRVARRTDARLQGHVDAWAQAHRETCEATRVRAIQSDSLHDLRMRCLTRAAASTRALVEALQWVQTPGDVGEAIAAVDALPLPSRCAAQAVRAEELAEPEDPAQRAAVAEIRATLDRGWAQYRLGRYGPASELATQAERESGELDDLPIRAEAGFFRGVTMARSDRPAAAEARLRAARLDAAAASLDRLAAEISLELLRTVMFAGDVNRVHDLADFARADALRAGAEAAQIDGIVGEARLHAGDAAGAVEPLQRAFAAERSASRRAIVRANLASARLELGDSEAAYEGYREAFEIAREHYGEGHPGLAFFRQRLGRGLRATGELEAAEAILREALAEREASFGASDRAVASVLVDLATVERERGRAEEARVHLERAAAIRRTQYGEHHASLAGIELLLGDIARDAGDLEGARAHYGRGLVVREAAAPGHPEVETLRGRLAALGTAAEPR